MHAILVILSISTSKPFGYMGPVSDEYSRMDKNAQKGIGTSEPHRLKHPES